LKDSEVIELAKKAGYEIKKVEAIVQEASQRQYYRIYSKISASIETEKIDDPKIFILCYLDPKIGSQDKFVEINKFIHEQTTNLVPKIYFYDKNLGITIQQDIGHENIYRKYLSGSIRGRSHVIDKAALMISLDALSRMHEINFSGLKRMKQRDLINQMKTFKTVYLDNFLGISSKELNLQTKNIDRLIEETICNLDGQPWVNCHTDFEGRNILITHDFDWTDRQTYIIDYQDMCIGPIGIDLAGVIFDHYWFNGFDENSLKKTVRTSFLSKSLTGRIKPNSFDDEVYEYARWGGIQRNMRILGTLSNLYMKDSRTFRLPDLELVLSNLIRIIPDDHAQLKKFFKNTVLTTNNKRVKEII
tara:strand:- start:177 stop:1256 length:1080 start_codon:yes stop_codon:yes gene_type:complete